MRARPIASICPSPPDKKPARWASPFGKPWEQLGDEPASRSSQSLRAQVEAHPEVLLTVRFWNTLPRWVRIRCHGATSVCAGKSVIGDPSNSEPEPLRSYIDKPEHRLEERRLAGAVRTDDPDELAALERQVDAARPCRHLGR